MTSSLVGSEMCIRDSDSWWGRRGCAVRCVTSPSGCCAVCHITSFGAVSYTHLTLPTICSV
eukprot:11349018-Prorocentrum_lima.AAC.1